MQMRVVRILFSLPEFTLATGNTCGTSSLGLLVVILVKLVNAYSDFIDLLLFLIYFY